MAKAGEFRFELSWESKAVMKAEEDAMRDISDQE